ncbi:MAG: MoxR family ATPase [bacterium]|nr:MoxR family ATPase [bacterium]
MLIGRQSELAQVRAALDAGLNLLLEGPVGVGKTHLILAAITDRGRPSWRVDGDERFTEQKMAGWFDPAAVMRDGYRSEHFIPGPLHQAMTKGGILFINELNRLPESVQNLLLPALDERLLQVPMLGPVHATTGFQVVATMNPREFIATSELSEALRDRFELLFIDYQCAAEEAEIVRLNLTDSPLPEGAAAADLDALINRAIDLVRLTRRDTAFRRGASIRAAISLVRLALALLAVDGLSPDDAFDRAARMALASRIEPAEETSLNALGTLDAWLEEIKKNSLSPLPN